MTSYSTIRSKEKMERAEKALMKLSERMTKSGSSPVVAYPTSTRQYYEVDKDKYEGFVKEVAQLEAENEAWKAYYRDATELAEAVSMSGNMRISPSDKIKRNAMKARLDALLEASK